MQHSIVSRLLVALFALASLAACSRSAAHPDAPPWLNKRIADYSKGNPRQAPDSIWKSSIDGKSVFYIRHACCDAYNELFDAEGRYMCAPDGGITGKGDSKCAPTGWTPSDMQLIWEGPQSTLRQQKTEK